MTPFTSSLGFVSISDMLRAALVLPKFVQGGTRHHLRAHHGWAHGFANFLLKYSSNDIKLGNPPKEMVPSRNYIDLSLSTYMYIATIFLQKTL